MTKQVLWSAWGWGKLLDIPYKKCSVWLSPMDTQPCPFCNGFSVLGWVGVTLSCPVNFFIQIVVTVATVRKYSKCDLSNEIMKKTLSEIKTYLRLPVWDGFYNFATVNSVKSRLSLIVRVNVVLNRTVVVDSDWGFDNLCGSHLQSQSELYHVSRWYSQPDSLQDETGYLYNVFLVRTITTRTLLDRTPTATLTIRRTSTLAMLRQLLYRTSEVPLKLLHVYYNLTIYVLHTNP